MTETISGGDDSTDAVGSAGPTDMSELVGWQPDFPPGPQRAVSDGLTVGMTDDEILALYRVGCQLEGTSSALVLP